MIEICLVNSTLNIGAMVLLIYYITKIHLASEFNKMDTFLYFLLAMMCALRITTDIQYLYNPVKENYIVLFPLVRNYLFVWFAMKFYKIIKK